MLEKRLAEINRMYEKLSILTLSKMNITML
ncbi:hypothetical protein HNR31_003686 [Anoxybacillus caldiproteolyticus]|uniref:Uncharacterized protein n=1 Tax=Thermaerobacillus caldiproteolyticus TaxID=247480 RepID=A0A7W0C084_9BACL|nr:hypothetical protein [Anoxybacillus caldiproteolyticus]